MKDFDLEKEKRKQEILERVIYKEQYKLKLGLVYLFASGFNFVIMLFCFILFKFFDFGLDICITIYFIMNIFRYKYSFNYKIGDNFNIFMFYIMSMFIRRIETSLRQNLKIQSAEKL